ncbi:MAG: YceI family protein [Halobacteriovoraceae bacterium]|nr:YceI family protein [Halobacteriovoraceae bacterium]
MNKSYFFIFICFICLSGLSSAYGENKSWKINRDHSEFFFKVPYLTVSEVTGSFSRFVGGMQFGEELGRPTELWLELEAQSITTGNKLRDGHLRSNDFLKSKKFPLISFKSNQIQTLGKGKLQASGVLTLAGVKKKMLIAMTMTESVLDPWGYQSRFIEVKGSLNRKDFGIVWNKGLSDSKFLVGDKITFSGRIQIQPSHSMTPMSKHLIPDTKVLRLRGQLKRGEITQSDYDQLVDTEVGKAELARLKLKEALASNPVKKEAVVERASKNIKRSAAWTVSFYFMIFLGFLATFIIAFYAKSLLQDKYGEAYHEVGRLGFLADGIAGIFALCFGLSLWFLQIG